MKYWYHETTKGTFYIMPEKDKFDIIFDDECLSGDYDDPQLAVDDLVGGHTVWPDFGDPSTLDIPEEIGEWQEAELDN